MDWKVAKPSELDEILDLLDTSFPVSRAYIQNSLKEILDDPESNSEMHRLKVDGNQIIGTATYARVYGKSESGAVWNGEGYLRYWAIHPDHRRQGYGMQILNKVMDDLKDAGAPCLCLSVLGSDRICRELYERLGFQHYDTHTPTDKTGVFGEHCCYVKWF